MTGVGGRPELIIEGSNTSNEDDWKVQLRVYTYTYITGLIFLSKIASCLHSISGTIQ